MRDALKQRFKALENVDNENKRKNATQKQIEELEKNNEVMELIYMGKVDINRDVPDTKPKYIRQFLIRRLRSLEIMFTNGLTHQVEPVPNSEVKYPFVISDVILGQNNQKLIVYNSVAGYDTQVQIKVYQKKNLNFRISLENTLKTLEKKNMTLDKFGNLYEIQVQMYSSQ